MSATLNNIAYGMRGSTLRTILNANKESIFTYTRNESSGIVDFAEGMTYAEFITKLNSVFALAPEKFYASNECESLTVASEGLPTKINSNFSVLSSQGDTFLNDGVPYFFNKKTLTIPSKGTANILCQNGAYKLAYYTGENTLYLSEDNGTTWGYSGTLPVSPTLLRLCHLFSDGSVLMGVVGNRLFSSQDKLQHITEIYVKEVNGDTMEFHTPINPLYPGTYFSAFITDSFIIGDKEILIWGVYASHDEYGATPRMLFASTDKGATVKVVYRFGSFWEGEQYDNGTALGGFEDGVALGDPASGIKIHHVHFTSYNKEKNKFWIQTGDHNSVSNVQIYFIECTYNRETDSWSFVFNPTEITAADDFRSCGLEFYNNGESCIWASDGSGNILKVPYADLTKDLEYHNVVYTAENVPAGSGYKYLLGMSKYDEIMIANRHSVDNALIISCDYGDNWVKTPENYSLYIDPAPPKVIMRQWDKDELGYQLIHKCNSVAPISLNATQSMLLEVKKKPVR